MRDALQTVSFRKILLTITTSLAAQGALPHNLQCHLRRNLCGEATPFGPSEYKKKGLTALKGLTEF